jgi:hypothetical protein
MAPIHDDVLEIRASSWGDRVISRLTSLLRLAEVDRAVFFALLTRGWQVLTGPLTLLLIAFQMQPEVQGFYYTFASLLALQSFVELGFYLVIINVASHEWARLGLDSNGAIVGESDALSRLVGLGRLTFKWYAVASTIFVIGVGSIGFVFFSRTQYSGIAWQAPWLVLVLLTGLMLLGLPFNSLLEGCGQMGTVNRFRLSQTIVGTLALWLTLVLGGGLWAAAVSVGVKLLRDVYLLCVQYRSFFASFFVAPTRAQIDWRREVWPMQWRLGLAGLMNYFALSLFTPVMFQYRGAAVAGQMGMTWAVVGSLQAVALAWVYSNVPKFGAFVANKDFLQLDQLWFRTSAISLAVISLGATAAWCGVYWLNAMEMSLADRMLSPFPFGLFLVATVLMQISQCQTAYILAHKQAPFAVQGVVSGLLIGTLVWLLGSNYGPTGTAVGYLAVVAFFLIPYETFLWRRCRAESHAVSG